MQVSWFRFNPLDVWTLKPYDTSFYKVKCGTKSHTWTGKLLKRLVTKESQLLGNQNKTPENIYKPFLGHDLDDMFLIL